MSAPSEAVAKARAQGLAVPAFNVPYLPMVEPVIAAVADADCWALVATARLEWLKFASQGPAAVAREYARWARPGYTGLHLDHVPVIDEDGHRVDYMPIVREALDLGYASVMIDGSRLPLQENIAITREVVELAHAAGVPCEAELGAVLGHEIGPHPPYEELFANRLGFTDPDEAQRFVRETGCDWLSVAIGNVHGAIAGLLKDQKKPQARLDLEHLQRLATATRVPLVLHGGSGLSQADVLQSMQRGIAKINIAAEIRQAYEQTLRETQRVGAAQAAVYQRTTWLLVDHLRLAGTRARLDGTPHHFARSGEL